jgi:hypothetical protein
MLPVSLQLMLPATHVVGLQALTAATHISKNGGGGSGSGSDSAGGSGSITAS